MVKNIIKTAKEMAYAYRKILLPVFLFLSVLELWKSMGLQLGLLGVILMITFIAIGHAEVMVGLKMTGQSHEPLDIRKDAYCGIYRIKELFSTYAWMEVAVIAFLMGVFSIFFLVAFSQEGLSFWQDIRQQIITEQQYGISITANQLISWIAILMVVVDVVVGYIVDCLFFLAPYYLETQQVKGLAALKMAVKKAKGHWRQIFSLQTHYYVMIIFFSCLNYLVTVYISSLFLSLAISIGLLVLEIHTYRMEYAISKALLFKEIENA